MAYRISRRALLRIGSGVVGTLALSACARAPSAAPGPTSAPAAAATGQAPAPPARSQLVVAQTADMVTLDPIMYRARQTQNIHQMLYDSLVHRTDDLQPQGRLAESWEVVDNTTYRLKMRSNAKFHDGNPVTAGDVKFSYDRTLDPALKAPRAGLLDMVAATEAPDDSTVIVHTKQPDPLTLVYLNYHSITPAALVKAQGDAFFQKPIGAGPFKFQEWRKNERVVLTANANYWEGAPLVQTLIFRPIADPSTMMAELESGGIDIAAEVPPASFSQVKSNPNLQALTAPSTTVHYVGLNNKLKPMDSVQVRQAMNYAVDKSSLINSVIAGLAVPISGPLFPESRGYDPSVTYTFDLDKARALLKEGGAESGFSATMDTTAPMKEIAEALAGQLKALGVTITVNVMELGALTTKINNGDCEMYLNNWGDSAADGAVTFYRHFSSSQREQFKDTWYSRPDLDKQIDDARFTFDFDQRKQLLTGIYKSIVNDAPWIFLWQPTSLAAARSTVKGFVPRADAYMFLNKVSVG
ncbi:MAG: ABC transporter substrate-binding protein [Chloroflexi bacterium]|nr:ABC transporter substrate-binding protein [Chloroflexota bacterium]